MRRFKRTYLRYTLRRRARESISDERNEMKRTKRERQSAEAEERSTRSLPPEKIYHLPILSGAAKGRGKICLSPDGATDKWRPTLQLHHALDTFPLSLSLFFFFFFIYIGLVRQSVQGLRSFYSRYRRSERLMHRVGFKYFTAICKSHREGPKIHATRIYVDQLFRKCSRRRGLNSLGREHSNATWSIDLCDSADYSPETEYRFTVVEFPRQVIRLVDSADNYPTTIINERSISLRTTIAPILTKLRKLTGRFSFFPSLQGCRSGFYNRWLVDLVFRLMGLLRRVSRCLRSFTGVV